MNQERSGMHGMRETPAIMTGNQSQHERMNVRRPLTFPLSVSNSVVPNTKKSALPMFWSPHLWWNRAPLRMPTKHHAAFLQATKQHSSFLQAAKRTRTMQMLGMLLYAAVHAAENIGNHCIRGLESAVNYGGCLLTDAAYYS